MTFTEIKHKLSPDYYSVIFIQGKGNNYIGIG